MPSGDLFHRRPGFRQREGGVDDDLQLALAELSDRLGKERHGAGEKNELTGVTVPTLDIEFHQGRYASARTQHLPGFFQRFAAQGVEHQVDFAHAVQGLGSVVDLPQGLVVKLRFGTTRESLWERICSR